MGDLRSYCPEHGDSCTAERKECVFRYDESTAPEHLRWKGEWPPRPILAPCHKGGIDV